VCVVLCTVFRLIVVLFCVMCFVCVLRLIVVPLPPGENPLTVKINIIKKYTGHPGHSNGLNGRSSISGRGKIFFSLLHSVQTRAHTASYTIG
jgi:hypothetical protein